MMLTQRQRQTLHPRARLAQYFKHFVTSEHFYESYLFMCDETTTRRQKQVKKEAKENKSKNIEMLKDQKDTEKHHKSQKTAEINLLHRKGNTGRRKAHQHLHK